MVKGWKPVVVGVVAVALFVAWPYLYFRYVYTHGKRLRVVVPGRFYRSGQLTAEGFTDTVKELGIRTIINVQDDVPDPDLDLNFWSHATIKESALCQKLGVRYVNLAPDLVTHEHAGDLPPGVIGEFLSHMDRESTYPALIHCRAGLHRTGVLCAVSRMEYQRWTPDVAFREMKAHGFGEFACAAANDYVYQYVLTYKPRPRHEETLAVGRHH
jgi:protein tyrosine/serine phosphatase